MIRQPSRFFRGQHLLLFLVGIVLFMMGPGGNRCLAHPGNVAAALAKVRPDGTFEVHFRFDLLAYIVGDPPTSVSDVPMNALLDGPPAELESRLVEAKQRFRQSFRVGSSDPEAIDSLTFPSAADTLQSVKDAHIRLPVMGAVTLTGHLPPGTKTIAFQFDEALGPVILTTEFPYQEPISEPIEAGAFSETHRIPPLESVAKAAADIRTPLAIKAATPTPSPSPKNLPQPQGATVALSPASAVLPAMRAATRVQESYPKAVLQPLPAPSPTPTPLPAKPVATPTPPPTPEPVIAASPPVSSVKEEDVPPPSLWLTHVARYIKMGYTHILPEGLDHILFVLGLFLLSTQVKALVKQVTAFTVAHSLTLALSLYGVISLPASFVEPAIAASIAFVAVENLLTKEMKAGRLAIVFGFGLIHGLGFAAALQSLGLQQKNLLTALLGFNAGVELGQLTVVAVAFFTLGRFRNHPNYRKFIVLPGSVMIAATAVFWMLQRIFFH